MAKKKPTFWALGMILFIVGVILAQLTDYLTLRDFFANILMISLPETILRWFYYKSDRYLFLISYRTENLEEQDDLDPCRDLMRSSLDMLSALAGLNLALIIIVLSQTPILNDVEEYLFLFSSFSAFIVFVVNLALCYSVTGPKMTNEIVSSALRNYYDFTLFGLFTMAITLTWGLRSFSQIPIFTLDNTAGQMSFVFGFGFLFFLYWKAYMINLSKNHARARKT